MNLQTPVHQRHAKELKMKFDVIIVGAGFSGLFMIYRLREMGISARIIESGSDVGGTWYWNRYPGARCDTESIQYSYSFSDDLQQEWEWSERYAGQPEILRYINYVSDRFDLRRDIHFNTRVKSAIFNETYNHWEIETDNNSRINATFCVMATGCLSSPNYPKIKGLGDFAGPTFHTGKWPHEEVDFSGKQVGVIGTGSSAIQAIPHIANKAKYLFVFQRTPNYAIPAHNHPYSEEDQRNFKARYGEIRKNAQNLPAGFNQTYNNQSALEVSANEREREYEKRWTHGGLPFMGAFTDLAVSAEANKTAAEFVRCKIRRIVSDQKIAGLLSPDTIIGCKRLCVDIDFYKTFNRSNVSLVDVSHSLIGKISTDGVIVAGKLYPIDILVLATGFDAMTGTLLKIDVRGKNGQTLSEKWKAGPRTALGLMTSGFPNLFMITGPGSPSVLTNMLTSIEQHVNWITECIGFLNQRDIGQIEPTLEFENDWVQHVDELASKTLRYDCSSWYLGANVPGKPRVFMPYVGGFPLYKEKCDRIVKEGYKGFHLIPKSYFRQQV